MKKLLLCGLAVSSILTTRITTAAIIDFSTMPNQANYPGNSDFTVTTYGGPETDVNLHPHIYSGRLVNSSDPAVQTNAYPTEDIINFAFNLGMDTVSIDMYWAGDPSFFSYSPGVTITSFDINGNILQQFGYLSGFHAIYNFDSTALIYSIQTNTNLLPNRDNWWYGINSIRYNAASVPEPASFALLGMGLVGITLSRKKRKTFN